MLCLHSLKQRTFTKAILEIVVLDNHSLRYCYWSSAIRCYLIFILALYKLLVILSLFCLDSRTYISFAVPDFHRPCSAHVSVSGSTTRRIVGIPRSQLHIKSCHSQVCQCRVIACEFFNDLLDLLISLTYAVAVDVDLDVIIVSSRFYVFWQVFPGRAFIYRLQDIKTLRCVRTYNTINARIPALSEIPRTVLSCSPLIASRYSLVARPCDGNYVLLRLPRLYLQIR